MILFSKIYNHIEIMYVSFKHSIIFAEKLNWGFVIFDKIIGHIFQNDIIWYNRVTGPLCLLIVSQFFVSKVHANRNRLCNVMLWKNSVRGITRNKNSHLGFASAAIFFLVMLCTLFSHYITSCSLFLRRCHRDYIRK